MPATPQYVSRAVEQTHAAKQPVGTRRQRFSAAHRQKKAAVELRRGDLAYRPPPWHLLFNTTAEELHTPDMIKVLDSQVSLTIDLMPFMHCRNFKPQIL